MNSGKWAHDLYEARGSNGQASRDRGFQSKGFRGKSTSGKIPFRARGRGTNPSAPKYEVVVTNLHWNVSPSEIFVGSV